MKIFIATLYLLMTFNVTPAYAICPIVDGVYKCYNFDKFYHPEKYRPTHKRANQHRKGIDQHVK